MRWFVTVNLFSSSAQNDYKSSYVFKFGPDNEKRWPCLSLVLLDGYTICCALCFSWAIGGRNDLEQRMGLNGHHWCTFIWQLAGRSWHNGTPPLYLNTVLALLQPNLLGRAHGQMHTVAHLGPVLLHYQ
jgi:hypothetical protein